MNIYKRYITKLALIWAVCFVIFVFAYILFLAPNNNNKKQIETQLAEQKQKYDSALKATRQETKDELNDQIENLKDNLQDFVIDAEQLSDLTFDIGQIANQIKISLFNIKIPSRQSDSSMPNCNYICENNINVDFTADFNQFATFLTALERHRPVVFVDKFSIKRSKNNDSAHQVNMELAVFTKKSQDS